MSDEQVNAKLDDIIKVFRLLYGNDTFLKQAESLLAKRMLNKTSLSHQYEEMMLQKLVVECGVQELTKMTQMMLDLELSGTINSDFQAHNKALDFGKIMKTFHLLDFASSGSVVIDELRMAVSKEGIAPEATWDFFFRKINFTGSDEIKFEDFWAKMVSL